MAQIYFINSISEKPLISAPFDGKNVNNCMSELFDEYNVIESGDRFAFFGEHGILFNGLRYGNSLMFSYKTSDNPNYYKDDVNALIAYVRDMFYESDNEYRKIAIQINQFQSGSICFSTYWELEDSDCTPEELKHAIYK